MQIVDGKGRFINKKFQRYKKGFNLPDYSKLSQKKKNANVICVNSCRLIFLKNSLQQLQRKGRILNKTLKTLLTKKIHAMFCQNSKRFKTYVP